MRKLAPLLFALAACNGNTNGGLYFGRARLPDPEPPPPTVLETKYKANTKIPTAVSTRVAVEIGPGDLDRFPQETTSVLGYLGLRVRVDAPDEELAGYIATEGAKRGATHFIVKSDDTTSHETLERDHESELRQRIFGGRYSYDGPIYKTTTRSERHAYAVLVALPESDWEKLPEALRPRPQRKVKAKTQPQPAATQE